MKRVVVFAICVALGTAAIAQEADPKPPSGWASLQALGPNLATYARYEDPKGAENSFSVQKYPREEKIELLHRQLESGEMPLVFGNLTVRYVDRWKNCYRFQPEKTLKILRQTWCFEKSVAWVVVENGPLRVGDAFVAQVLRAHGFRGDE